MSNPVRNRLSQISSGLDLEQKVKLAGALERIRLLEGGGPGGGKPYNYPGWSLYREPSTINPPTTVRLLKRNADGRLLQVINIAGPN